MFFAWARRIALGGCLLAVGCKGGAEGPASVEDAGSDGAVAVPLSFAFDPAFACAGGGLCAPPSQVVTFAVTTVEGAPVQIGLEGNYADAALTADEVAPVGGQALVALETSSTPSTFTIVARTGSGASSESAKLTVTVGAFGFATVRISPSYTGKRDDPGFLAVAMPLTSCAQLDVNAPNVVTWLPSPNDTPLTIAVGADERVAIYVRLGHYATGCADVAPLAASATSDVSIDVYDVPMALGLTDMNATFKFTPSDSAASSWTAAMTVAGTNVGDAFFGSASDGTALLDAMRAQVPPAELTSFDADRDAGGWNATATAWLSAHAPSIHQRAATWLAEAAGDGVAPLVVHLGAGLDAGTATVTPTTLGTLTAAQAGVSTSAPFDWTAAADDTVHLSGPVVLASSPYIAQLANAHAQTTLANPTLDVPGAIALQIDCQGLASELVGTGNAYGACGAMCFGEVCVSALSAAWSAAFTSPSNGSDAVTISLTVGAPADVGDQAEPQYFEGGWLGQVTGVIVASPFSTAGTVIGIEPSSATP
jgi:hypothetical protein